MQKIQNSTICNFFYVFYVVYAFIFALSVLSLIGTIYYSKKMGAAGIAASIQALLLACIGATSTLFYYLICDRALIGKAVQDVQENFSGRKN